MFLKRITVLLVLLGSLFGGYALFSYHKEAAIYKGFTLGLDLSGGTRLAYDVDIKNLTGSDLQTALGSLRDTVERRVNAFGVSEPVVFTQSTRTANGKGERLMVELPSVDNLETAQKMIGDTPVLEFKVLKPGAKPNKDSKAEDVFISSGLTGEFLKRASVQFSQGSATSGLQSAMVSLEFNKEGSDIFAKITKEQLGKPVAIYLDGQILSAPTVQSEIVTGQAVITGNFTVEEAQLLAKRLNAGALPLSINLVSSEVIKPLLGDDALAASVKAGVLALLIIAVFMVFWYRLPGLLASLSLITYSVIVLALFKWIPVTLSTAGIAGFIISIGIAVDANILIFERAKEELLKGKNNELAFLEGFARAWPSIRDSNISSLISSLILFSFGSSIVKGFALTLGVGVIVSLVTALTVTKLYIKVIASPVKRRWMILSGFNNK